MRTANTDKLTHFSTSGSVLSSFQRSALLLLTHWTRYDGFLLARQWHSSEWQWRKTGNKKKPPERLLYCTRS